MRKIIALILGIISVFLLATNCRAEAAQADQYFGVDYYQSQIWENPNTEQFKRIYIWSAKDAITEDHMLDYIADIESNAVFFGFKSTLYLNATGTSFGDKLVNAATDSNVTGFYNFSLFNFQSGKYRKWGTWEVSQRMKDQRQELLNSNIGLEFMYSYGFNTDTFYAADVGFVRINLDVKKTSPTTPQHLSGENPYLATTTGSNGNTLLCVTFYIEGLYLTATREEVVELRQELTNLTEEIVDINKRFDYAKSKWQENVFFGQTLYGLMAGIAAFCEIIFELGFLGMTVGNFVSFAVISAIVYWIIKHWIF